jgi:hypothetical protein
MVYLRYIKKTTYLEGELSMPHNGKIYDSIDPAIHKHPEELLRNLIRFDTTNPPGNETGCINYINNLMQKAGFETQILAKDPNRPNLIVRLKGNGSAPPLMLYGHVDVVTTARIGNTRLLRQKKLTALYGDAVRST